MPRSNRMFAVLAVACALALPSCHSAAGGSAKANPNVTILERGPHGHPAKVRVDGQIRDAAVLIASMLGASCFPYATRSG